MIYRKYEFTSKDKWLDIKSSLYIDGVLIPGINAIHEIGFICLATDDEGECKEQSTKYAVDMLLNEPMEALKTYEVYPKPCGVHLFAGQDKLYLKSYCEVNPDSEYCKKEDLEL
jgi:hypothetical protein